MLDKYIALIVIFLVVIIGTYLITSYTTTEHIFWEDVAREASIYDPNADGYKYDDNVKKSVNTIQKTDDCKDLRDLWDGNWNWYAKPMLAKKIQSVC
ncbi:hypothetical protein LCGC14_1470020 [marine sediment metagenome]|uniref:Uncharacterized protein n=1 Tax=marine sediment metagenome TaxID=412755 RepID=A0A0F9LT19_9ZZZZ